MRYDLVGQTYDSAPTVDQVLQQPLLYYASKRLFDILVFGCLLFSLVPLMVVIAILIIVVTPGPAIFVQERMSPRRRKEGGDKHGYADVTGKDLPM